MAKTYLNYHIMNAEHGQAIKASGLFGEHKALVAASALAAGLVITSVFQQEATGESKDVNPEDLRTQNAIVFIADDAADFDCADTKKYLPKSSKWLLEQGTCYENATSSTPVCCPARSQIQTGQLAHNNDVKRQIDAVNLRPHDTVQYQLGRVGIATYGIGKNLNGIKAASNYGPNAIENGFTDFDFWDSYQGAPGAFNLFTNDGEAYMPNDGLNSTQTTGRFVLDYLAQHSQSIASGESDTSDKGFFIYSAFYAPHTQNIQEAKGTAADYPNVTAAHANDVIEGFEFEPERADKDKLAIFHGAPETKEYYKGLYEARVRAMRDIDDQVAAIFERLEATGELDETAVFFMSDNGFTERGQYNWNGKAIPYPAAMNIPMLAYYPGVESGVSRKMVSLIDIAPTLYQLYGVASPVLQDGHSLLDDTYSRDYMYGEFYSEASDLVVQESGKATTRVRSWRVLREGEQSYVEWYDSDGNIFKREYYRDRAMLNNELYDGYDKNEPPSPKVLRHMQQLMYAFSVCRGTVEQNSLKPCT